MPCGVKRAGLVPLAAAAAFVAAAHATTSPTKIPCPAASVLDSTLGVSVPTTFATSEKAVKALSPVNVKGLGQAAWTLKSGGDLYVYNKGITLKIIAPLITSAKLEALAKKLL
jgi:hypothetical protein